MTAIRARFAKNNRAWTTRFGYARACWWRALGADIGKRTSILSGCQIERPWCVKIGQRSRIEYRTRLKLVDDEANLIFGSHVFIGAGCQFDVIELCTIGNHTLFAPGCFVTDHNHATSTDLRINQQSCVAKATTIGSDVWVGAGSRILAGVTIGDGAIIGAGAVVNRSVGDMMIAVGVPAREVGFRDG